MIEKATRYALSLIALGYCAIVLADETATKDIPPQPLNEALRIFADQSGLQLVYRTELAAGIESKGTDSPETDIEALDQLLASTGLEHRFVNDRTVAIQIATKEASGSEPGKTQPASNPVLIAQNQTSAAQSQTSQANPTSTRSDDTETPLDLEEIIVTGSNIRGVNAVGVDVVTLDREYIQLSGISTTTEVIQSVPQNFGIGNEAVETVGFISNTGDNRGFASSVNLRGLGTDSTLMLLNGRRVASGGSSGNFVDLNSIPLAAIERIEVLPDGASAIYGSDAVGGVINVILRDDYGGAETSIRYVPGTSDIDEIQFSQVFGKQWGSGNVLFTYEYYDRSELKSEDRDYTRDSDLTSFGGTDHSISGSNPGNIIFYVLSDGTFAPVQLAIPSDQDGTALDPADLIDGATNLQNIREGTYVLPRQERNSAFVSATQRVTDVVELFAEGRYSKRDFETRSTLRSRLMAVPNTNAFFVDPFGDSQSLFIRYSTGDDYGPGRLSGDVETLGGVVGTIIQVGKSWEIELHGSHTIEDTLQRVDRFPNSLLLAEALADPNPATAFNPFGDGSFTNPETLAAIEGFVDFEFESELSTINLVASGELFGLPGGAVRLAVGGQLRDQSLSSGITDFGSTVEPVPGASVGIFSLDRDVTAGFAELYFPLVTDQNDRAGVRDFVVSVAGRFENYSDFGDTFDPKLGLSWSPVRGLSFRGTIGTSFRAPLLTELDTTANAIRTRNRADPTPTVPDNRTIVLTMTGNSPDLVPQEGTNWTVGFDVAPESLPGLTAGLTYFSTDVDDVIQQPLSVAATVLLDPVTNAPIIRRIDPNNPDDIAAVNALLADPACTHPTCSTPAEEIGAIVDARLQNIAKAEVAGLDFNLDYAFDVGRSNLNLSMKASHLFEFKEQLAGGPLVDKVDTIAKPNSLNLRGSLSWSRGAMRSVLTGKHIGSYTDNLFTPECVADPCSVSSWTTWDLHLGYEFDDGHDGLLGGTRFSLNIQNLFDKDPPFVDVPDAGVGFDAINANPLQRYVAFQVSKSW